MPQPSLDTALQNISLKKDNKEHIHISKIEVLIKFLYHIIVIPLLLLGAFNLITAANCFYIS